MLIAYAISAVFLIALRKLPGKALIAVGAAVFLLSIPNTVLMQYIAGSTDVSLVGLWESPGEGRGAVSTDGLPGAMFGLTLLGYFFRGLGLILLGAGLYRLGFMNGSMTPRAYRLAAAIGLGIGLPLATVGVIVTGLGDYSREVAFTGQIPNTIGTIPAALGFMSLIILWNQSDGMGAWLKRRLLAAGRMALTNYLSQTCLGGSDTHCPAGRGGREPRRDIAFLSGGVGIATVVVAGLSGTLPVRPGRVAVAGCDLLQGAAATARRRVTPDRPAIRVQ